MKITLHSALIVSLSCAALSVQAATITWDGDSGADSNWSTGGNWVSGAAPTDNTTTDIAEFNNTALSGNRTPNLSTDRSVTGVVFSGSGYNLTATGAATLTLGQPAVAAPNNYSIVGNAAGSNTISSSLATSSITASRNYIQLSNGSNLTLASSSTTTFNVTGATTSARSINIETGVGSTLTMAGQFVLNNTSSSTAVRITKTGAGAIRFTTANTYTGFDRLAISGGSVIVSVNNVLNGSPIITTATAVESKSILIDTAGVTLNSQVQFLNGGAGTVHTIGGSNTSGVVTFDSGATALQLSAANTGGTDAEKLTQFTAASGGRVEFLSNIVNNSAVTANRQGGINKIGAGTVVLTGSNTYTLGTTVAEGTLLLNNTAVGGSGVGSGNLTVNTGATLGGDGGRVNLAAGNSINVNGTVAVGDGNTAGLLLFSTSGAGAFNLNDNSFVTLDIWTNTANGVDRISTLAGATNIGNNVTLTVTNAGGVTFALNNSFNLFDWNGGSPIGDFDNLILPTLTGGMTWDTSALYSTGLITVVPEPSTVALAGLGLLCTLHLVRRRRA